MRTFSLVLIFVSVNIASYIATGADDDATPARASSSKYLADEAKAEDNAGQPAEESFADGGSANGPDETCPETRHDRCLPCLSLQAVPLPLWRRGSALPEANSPLSEPADRCRCQYRGDVPFHLRSRFWCRAGFASDVWPSSVQRVGRGVQLLRSLPRRLHPHRKSRMTQAT